VATIAIRLGVHDIASQADQFVVFARQIQRHRRDLESFANLGFIAIVVIIIITRPYCSGTAQHCGENESSKNYDHPRGFEPLL
jgi:hypothetical protein